jgi:flagellar basal body-associated protein FliL
MPIQPKQEFKQEKMRKILLLSIILAIIVFITYFAYNKIVTTQTEVYSIYESGVLTTLKKTSDGFTPTDQHYQTTSIDTLMKYGGVDKNQAIQVLQSPSSSIVKGYMKSKNFMFLVIILIVAVILLFAIVKTIIVLQLGMKHDSYRYYHESTFDSILSAMSRWST